MGIFLDISKAFDKVWHEGLIFKLKTYGIDDDSLKLLINYLEDRKQRVVLNEQTSSWKSILAGVPQGSVLDPILFLIYINDLPDRIKSICKIFADDTSLFSKVKDKNCSTVELNNDLKIISNKTIQIWKRLFNPDPNKQAVQILFSKKHEKDNYLPLNFNGDKIQRAVSQKHLGLVLDSKLDFNEHISNKINKCNKIIGIMKKLSLFLSRKTLLTIHKSFVRPNLDCADIIYDKPLDESVKAKIEMIQYRAALVITGAIKGTSRDRLYQEIALESLADRRWSCKIFFFHKIVNGLLSSYFQSYLNHYNDGEYQTRSGCQNKMRTLSGRTKAFNSSFYPYSTKEWFALSKEIRNIVSVNKFKEIILSFIRTKKDSVFEIHDTKVLKLLTRLRLNFSHLNKHKYRHGFKDTVNPICNAV